MGRPAPDDESAVPSELVPGPPHAPACRKFFDRPPRPRTPPPLVVLARADSGPSSEEMFRQRAFLAVLAGALPRTVHDSAVRLRQNRSCRLFVIGIFL